MEERRGGWLMVVGRMDSKTRAQTQRLNSFHPPLSSSSPKSFQKTPDPGSVDSYKML